MSFLLLPSAGLCDGKEPKALVVTRGGGEEGSAGPPSFLPPSFSPSPRLSMAPASPTNILLQPLSLPSSASCSSSPSFLFLIARAVLLAAARSAASAFK